VSSLWIEAAIFPDFKSKDWLEWTGAHLSRLKSQLRIERARIAFDRALQSDVKEPKLKDLSLDMQACRALLEDPSLATKDAVAKKIGRKNGQGLTKARCPKFNAAWQAFRTADPPPTGSKSKMERKMEAYDDNRLTGDRRRRGGVKRSDD
jgi:hypothetical protein